MSLSHVIQEATLGGSLTTRWVLKVSTPSVHSLSVKGQCGVLGQPVQSSEHNLQLPATHTKKSATKRIESLVVSKGEL